MQHNIIQFFWCRCLKNVRISFTNEEQKKKISMSRCAQLFSFSRLVTRHPPPLTTQIIGLKNKLTQFKVKIPATFSSSDGLCTQPKILSTNNVYDSKSFLKLYKCIYITKNCLYFDKWKCQNHRKSFNSSVLKIKFIVCSRKLRNNPSFTLQRFYVVRHFCLLDFEKTLRKSVKNLGFTCEWQ